MMQYMAYLKEDAEREKQREKELDRMLQAEVWFEIAAVDISPCIFSLYEYDLFTI